MILLTSPPPTGKGMDVHVHLAGTERFDYRPLKRIY